MFRTLKLKQENKQLEQENANLRYELEDQKDLTRQREQYGLAQHQENFIKGKIIENIKQILEQAESSKTPAVIVVDKIKEVVRQQNKTTSGNKNISLLL